MNIQQPPVTPLKINACTKTKLLTMSHFYTSNFQKTIFLYLSEFVDCYIATALFHL